MAVFFTPEQTVPIGGSIQIYAAKGFRYLSRPQRNSGIMEGYKTTLDTSGKDVKIHSVRVEKMIKLHSKRVEKMSKYTRNEWKR